MSKLEALLDGASSLVLVKRSGLGLSFVLIRSLVLVIRGLLPILILINR